jgi:hypothetical protein
MPLILLSEIKGYCKCSNILAIMIEEGLKKSIQKEPMKI